MVKHGAVFERELDVYSRPIVKLCSKHCRRVSLPAGIGFLAQVLARQRQATGGVEDLVEGRLFRFVFAQCSLPKPVTRKEIKERGGWTEGKNGELEDVFEDKEPPPEARAKPRSFD